jgi:hypothetical protein
MLSAKSWCIFAKCCTNLKRQKLFAQKELCFGDKNVGEFDTWQNHIKITYLN